MVYAVTSSIKTKPDFSSTGTIRLVNMSEVQQPKEYKNDPSEHPIYSGAHHFSNFEDAKAHYNGAQREWAQTYPSNEIQFSDETWLKLPNDNTRVND